MSSRFAVLWACCLAVWSAAAQPNASAIRLALVDEAARATPASDVLTAELSHRPGLQMLERAQIQKVLREQQLSATDSDYLKLGRLLGADGLLVLEEVWEGTNQFLGMRLVSVNSGVVLTHERYPRAITDLRQWAAGAADHLSPVLPKLKVLLRDAIAISVVNLRSALQTAEARETERQMTLLTIERLSREPRVFVLERRKMESLGFETELQGSGESSFWSGSYLLEGTIDRDGYAEDRMTVNARLIPPRGGAPTGIDLTGKREKPGEVANALARRVMEALNVNASSAAWDAEAEAAKYFEEARWAARWGLFPQAQTASESAWALGRRNRELALLRVRVYRGDVTSALGGHPIPAVPEPAALRPIQRALELVCQDMPLTKTNGAGQDQEWFDSGVQTVEAGAVLLEAFYYAAEQRQGNEEPLAHLRSLVRQTVGALDPGTNRARLAELKWEEGGIWYDHPEQALPMLQEVLESGYHPVHLPRLVGWTWNERKLVPRVLQRFVEGLRASTNTGVRMEGLYLAVKRTPHTAEGGLEAREKDLLAALWQERDWLFRTKENAELLVRAEEALHDQFGYRGREGYFSHEPFVGLRMRLWVDYLANAKACDYGVFEALFSWRLDLIGPSEAQALVPLMEQYSQRLKTSWPLGTLQFLREKAGVAAPVVAPQPPAVRAEELVAARFVPWHLRRPQRARESFPDCRRGLIRGNKLWLEASYIEPSSAIRMQTSFVAVDLETGEGEEIPFPEQMTRSAARFEVGEDALFVSMETELKRYRFKDKVWDALPVPVESGARIVELNHSLYLGTDSGVLAIKPDSGQVEVLVSSRRQPPANAVDRAWKAPARLYARGDGKLGVVMTNDLFVFTPGSGAWEHLPPLPVEPLDQFTAFYSDGGVLMLFHAKDMGVYLLGLPTGDGLMRPLLRDEPPDEPWLRAARQKWGKTHWDWPKQFPLSESFIVAEGDALWILTPRRIWPMFFPAAQEPVAFQDARQATLLRFESGRRRPLSVAMGFPQDNRESDPFSPDLGVGTNNFRRHFGSFAPVWLNTPDHLVLEAAGVAGHWLIPKATLRPKLEARRRDGQGPAEEPEAGGPSAPPASRAARVGNAPQTPKP